MEYKNNVVCQEILRLRSGGHKLLSNIRLVRINRMLHIFTSQKTGVSRRHAFDRALKALSTREEISTI